MKRTNKKGFTIVELVIVIAVIAILAAVLVPTFSNLINKANVSNDTVLVRELNKLVQISEIEQKDIDVNRAMQIAEENGWDVTKLSPRSDGNIIIWDDENDRFALVSVDSTSGVITQWLVGSNTHTSNDAMIFLFSGKTNIPMYAAYNYMFPVKSGDIQSALDNLANKENASITLAEDITRDFEIQSGTKLRLNLNGKTVSNAGESASTITIQDGAVLTIDGAGRLVNNIKDNPIIDVKSGGEIIINSGTFGREDAGEGSWYSIVNNGKATLGKDVVMDVPKSALAGSGASMIVNKGDGELVIEGGYYYTDGSANVKIESGKVTINGGTFINGSGQCIMNYGDLTINGGDFSLSGRDSKYTNAVVNNGDSGEVVINGGTFTNNVVGQNLSKDFVIYTSNANMNIYGGQFSTIGRLFKYGSPAANVYGGTFEYTNSGTFSTKATHTIYDYMKGDTTIRRIFSMEAPDYDAAVVVVSSDGENTYYTYYKDINFNFGISDEYSYYFYESRTEQLKLNYSYTANVYYMNNSLEEVNIVPGTEGYLLIKNEIDVGDSGAVKAYTLSCNGDPETSVAMIGEKYYADMTNALNQVGEGETIILLQDATYSSTAYDYDEYNFTIDLNGNELTLAKNITMADGKTLTILDSVGTGKLGRTGTAYIGAGKGTLDVKGGTISCSLNSNATSGLVKIDLDKVTLVGTPLATGRFNINPTNYIGRGYACSDNGDGTWKVAMAEGYDSVSPGITMKAGYIEVFDGTKYYAVKIESAELLTDDLKGKVVNGNLTSIDPTAYVADGLVVSVTTKGVYTVKADSNLISGTYTTKPEGVGKNYMVCQNDDKYVIVYINSNLSKYSGKICGGLFTETQKEKAVLAEGYQWEQQADGTWKVVAE